MISTFEIMGMFKTNTYNCYIGFGRVFYNNARLSAEGIFQIAAIMGSCVAGGAYLPIMSDEALIVERTGTIFLAGSHLVKAAIGEKMDNESLGGAEVRDVPASISPHPMNPLKESISFRNIQPPITANTASMPMITLAWLGCVFFWANTWIV